MASLELRRLIEEIGLQIRHSDERAQMDRGWIRTKYSFIPQTCTESTFSSFRSLRALNESYLEPSKEIPFHFHRDVEIVIYVIEGELDHTDGKGHCDLLSAGTFQMLNCGIGNSHALRNASSKTLLHFVEIQIDPETTSISPNQRYKWFPTSEREGQLRLVASRNGTAGSLQINQDVRIFSSILPAGEVIEDRIAQGRYLWVQIIRGLLMLNDQVLSTGDGAALVGNGSFELKAPLHGENTELLLFDLG